MATSLARIPVPQLHVREYGGRYFYEAKFWLQGRQVKRRIGPASSSAVPWADRWTARPCAAAASARDLADMRPLRWHDLRHTFGSTPAAGGIDLVTIKAVMGHSDLKTTERCLHARSEAEMAARFTHAFSPTQPAPAGIEERVSGHD